MTFNPFPYSVTGPTGGSGGPMPSMPAQSVPQDVKVVVAHSREVDLREIAGDIDPPVRTTLYTRDYFLLVPADCAFQRLRLSAERNRVGCVFSFALLQLNTDGVRRNLIPDTAVRQLDLTPTDYESVANFEPDCPVILRVSARYQTVRLFVTLEALYTSAPAQ